MASNSAPPSSIVFKARGMKPDVCLQVFDTNFHVHSVVLKLHSHFFYTFFDSADKSGTRGGAFKYEWVTKVVDDGKDWQLVCKGPKAGNISLDTYKGDKEDQTTAFSKLMSAFYNQIFSLQNSRELSTMTSLARFYVALPVLSHSLYAAFRHSESSGMIQNIADCTTTMILIATELRHPELFRDAVTLLVGHWKFNPSETYARLESAKQKKAIKNAHNELQVKFSKAQHALLEEIYTSSKWDDAEQISTKSIHVMKEMKRSNTLKISLPEYYRRLYEIGASNSVQWNLRKAIKPLFENNLCLPRPSSWVEEKRKNYFFCITIDDEDLPWDTTQTVW